MRRGKNRLLSRRGFVICGTAAVWLCVPRGSTAQPNKVPLIGWLSSASSSEPLLAAFRAGLRGLGYVEGSSVRLVSRSAQGNAELRTLGRELTQQQPDVIVANGRGATRAAQEATAAIPVIMAPVDDPYEFVASLSRPSGNITGLAIQQTAIDAKQVEILKEIVPTLSRLAIFYYYGQTYYALESTAHALGIEPQWIEINARWGLEGAFAEALSRKANGLLIVDADALGGTCNIIGEMALARGVPAAASWRSGVESGLILTYAADDRELQHRAASYVDRLLRGAKPHELPIEQATQFELLVNLKVAKELGVTVPPSVLLRASSVID